MKRVIVVGVLSTVAFLAIIACTSELIGAGSLEMDRNSNEESLKSFADNYQYEAKEWGVLSPFEEDGLWGFKNDHDEIIVEPQYSYVHPFSEGLAFARGVEGREYQTGFIDLTGKLIIPLPYIFSVSRFSEGFALIREWDGLTDDEFLDPWVPAAIGSIGYVIFIDRTGQDVFGQKFHFASPFSEGLAFTRGLEGKEHMTGFIDTTGALVIPLPNVIEGGTFSEGFAVITKRMWDRANENVLITGTPGPRVFIDRAGQNTFGQEFLSVTPFSDGLARVSLLNGNMAFIDTTGRNAFRREFRLAGNFDEDGYASVTLLDGSGAIIHRSGTIRYP